jgi:hypothetical protein
MNLDLYGFGPALAAGTLMTIKLALCALSLGLVLGLLGALAKTSPYKPLQWLGGTYSTIVRGGDFLRAYPPPLLRRGRPQGRSGRFRRAIFQSADLSSSP